MLRACLLTAAMVVCLLGVQRSAASSPNLIVDGGFEQVTRQAIHRSPYLEKAIAAGVDLLREGDDAVLPAAFSQLIATKRLKVVEGKPGDMVHSGTRALLVNGGMYLRAADDHSYKTREGDLVHVEFHAKGQGDAGIWFHVTGSGKVGAVRLETKGKTVPTQWTKIEHTLLIVGAGAQDIYPRIATTGDVLIDDLVIRKLPAAGDAVADAQRASTRERAKSCFVYPMKTPPVIDGKLDDPCWRDVPEFAGFLSSGDQAVFADPPTAMKLGYDAENLYLGITCTEPDMSILSLLDPFKEVAAERWIGPTTVEIFLDPSRSRVNYCQFAATARGHKYEGFKSDGGWNASWEVRSEIQPDGYCLEIRIPLASFDVCPTLRPNGTVPFSRRSRENRDSPPERPCGPAVGDVWGLNVCRSRATMHSTWAPVGSNYHNPSGFGQMVFGSPDQWYREAFLPGVARTRETILARSRELGMPELAARVRLVDAYVDEIKAAVAASSVDAKDWRRIADLQAMAGFALESYERIQAVADWSCLEAKGDKP